MRILLPRFDTHGDIILLAGLLEALLARYADGSVTLLVRPGYDQLAPLLPPGLRWQTIALRPYEPLRARDGQLDEIRAHFRHNRYDLLLGTCFSQTWADATTALAANPEAKRIALCGPSGPLSPPPTVRAELGERAAWDQTVVVHEESDEVFKYEVLWRLLTGADDASLPPPRLRVPDHLDGAAHTFVRDAGLSPGGYVTCCPAGTANITIKAWPAERFAQVLGWLEERHRLPALLVGHENERGLVESVRRLSTARGARPRVWLGRDGELPLLAALLRASRCFVGNDTGPMHAATALGVPAVAVFGGGHWPRFVPRHHAVALVRELLCFGCDWQCMFGEALCVDLISVEAVRQAVESILVSDPAAHDGLRPSRVVRLEAIPDAAGLETWLRKAESRRRPGDARRAGWREAVGRRWRALRGAGEARR